jgi:hypothetical protein
MIDYGALVQRLYKPIIDKYGFAFAQLDGTEMFLIGDGFALYVFVDPRDGSNTWYASLNTDGNIIVRTLDYVFAERLTEDDRNQYISVHGKPQNLFDRVVADLSISNICMLNHFHDVLSGDTQWLQNYPDKGDYSRHVARFLAPYFQRQGYYVKPPEETLG